MDGGGRGAPEISINVDTSNGIRLIQIGWKGSIMTKDDVNKIYII